MCAHFCSQTCNFRNSSGNKSCFCIITIAKSICCTGSKSNDIFQRTTQLYAKCIRCCIHTKYRAHKNPLKVFCCLSLRSTDHAGCRNSSSYFFCVAWSGKHIDSSHRNFLTDDICHGHQCLFLNSFCNINNDLSFFYMGCHQCRCASDIRRRYSKDDHFCRFHAALHICSNINILRDMYPRKFGSKFSCVFQSIYLFLKSGPETHFMSVIIQKNRKRSSPASSSQHTDFCHIRYPLTFL